MSDPDARLRVPPGGDARLRVPPGGDARLRVPPGADAHAWLAGHAPELDAVVAQTRAAPDAATWEVVLDGEGALRVEGLHRLAGDVGATPVYSLAPDAALDGRARALLADFARRALLADPARRRAPALAAADAALLRDLSPPPEPPEGAGPLALARLAGLAARALVDEARVPRPARPATDAPPPMASPVLIGAYGGEHVGDAAILGGVLLRLHERHGARQAALGSFRPAHTERWVRGLDVPVAVRVFPYEPANVARELETGDGLVWAGGPMMDLPNLLVRHWHAALAAHRRGLPFVVDRIGVGPFASRASRAVARRIARRADVLSLRTSGAARQPEVRGLELRVERDPAFDYLASRAGLGRLAPADRRDADALLAGGEGRLTVGVNLRPIRHRWHPEGEAASRAAEARFRERFAAALVEAARRLPVRFVFFPMNPIQLGGSDLRAAFELHRAVGRDVDLRVWQGDPDVDGLLHLLRGLDAAVGMRFHACIFALAQGLPTLGIDYYPGAGGKVEELFADRGEGDRAVRMDRFEPGWLVERLEAIAAARPEVP